MSKIIKKVKNVPAQAMLVEKPAAPVVAKPALKTKRISKRLGKK